MTSETFPKHRRVSLVGLSLLLLAGIVQAAAAGTVVDGRCDLQSSPLSGTAGCLDLDKISGTTLDVPEAVTRFSRNGLVLCGIDKLTVPGNDLAYIVDQSGSMTAFRTDDLILPHKGDTLNFGGCKEWTSPSGTKFPGTLPSVKYKGYAVQLLPPEAYDSAMVRCSPSGDPYQVRAKVVQAAITKQAQLAPSSTAAFLSFGSKYSSTKLFSLHSVASRDSLLKQVIDTNLDKTYYADPIGWARALLQGAKSGSRTMAASPNKRKAIILVSDGAPNDADSAFAKLEAGKTVKAPDGTAWTLPDTTSPPIYGFMLSTSASSGNALKKLATATGGAYYQIPPLDRDSLNRVMERLLGLLATRSTPDSLRITNLTNGQATNSVSSGAEGAGFRFPLDSIVGLELGKNVLELRSAMHGPSGDSVRTVRWTLNVLASSKTFAPDGADSTLMAACYAPTRLTLRPSIDTARHFADQRDTKLSTFLDVRPAGNVALPLRFSTSVSRDSLVEALDLKLAATAARTTSIANHAWSLSLSTPVRTDAVVQTGYGWDTLRAVFRMPRDPRDSAAASLPVLHPPPENPRLRLRFLRDDGTVADSLASDTLVRRRVRIRLQLWSATQAVSRSGPVRAGASDARLFFTDSAGRVDSVFRLVDGLVSIWIRSDLPANALAATFTPDSSWDAATATPLAWRAPAPDSAVYLDRNGDGVLDGVRVHFASPWNPSNRLTFPWPDSAHLLDPSQAAITPSQDSLAVEWSFAFAGRPPVTAWEGKSVRGGFAWDADDDVRAFPIREAIAPVPVRARLRIGDAADTLRVWMSEPVAVTDGAEWVRWGRPSQDPLGVRVDRRSQDTLSSRQVELLVDTTFPATAEDSIRLAAWPSGGIGDLSRNGPAEAARWVPLEVVPGPFRLAVTAWPSLTAWTNWTIPPGEPALSLFVRTSPRSSWLSPDGTPAVVDASHYSGMLIKLSRTLKSGMVHIYDNAGIAVARVDLAPVLDALAKGRIGNPLRGDVQIWAAWNGRSADGRMVASGVYLARVFGQAEVDGKDVVYNHVHRLGWSFP